MSFDSSSSSMLTPTEMRTSSESPKKAEKLGERKKLTEFDEEESEAWRNIFQQRFDKRVGKNRNQATFLNFDVFGEASLVQNFLQESIAKKGQVSGELEEKQGEDAAAASLAREVQQQIQNHYFLFILIKEIYF